MALMRYDSEKAQDSRCMHKSHTTGRGPPPPAKVPCSFPKLHLDGCVHRKSETQTPARIQKVNPP